MTDMRLTALLLCLAGPLSAQSYECLMSPWRTVEIGSPAAGLIDQMMIDRGDRVAAGQVLARLDSEVEAASAALAERRATSTAAIELAAARLAFEETNLERRRELYARGALPEQDLAEAEATAEIARLRVTEAEEARQFAELEADRARAILKRRVIASPTDGVVMRVGRSPGEYLSPSDALASIAVTASRSRPSCPWMSLAPLPSETPSRSARRSPSAAVFPAFWT